MDPIKSDGAGSGAVPAVTITPPSPVPPVVASTPSAPNNVKRQIASAHVAPKPDPKVTIPMRKRLLADYLSNLYKKAYDNNTLLAWRTTVLQWPPGCWQPTNRTCKDGSGFTAAGLRFELSERGLDTWGVKYELEERLCAALLKEGKVAVPAVIITPPSPVPPVVASTSGAPSNVQRRAHVASAHVDPKPDPKVTSPMRKRFRAEMAEIERGIKEHNDRIALLPKSPYTINTPLELLPPLRIEPEAPVVHGPWPGFLKPMPQALVDGLNAVFGDKWLKDDNIFQSDAEVLARTAHLRK